MTINLLFLDKPFLLPSEQRQGLMWQFLENYYIFDCLRFIYWCEVFSENTWIKKEYFSANKELNFLFDKKFPAYLPSDFTSQWARTVKPGLMVLISISCLWLLLRLLWSLYTFLLGAQEWNREDMEEKSVINKMHCPLAMNVFEEPV